MEALRTPAEPPPPNSELGIAMAQNLAIESYLLNSIFTHKSARYALDGFCMAATDQKAVSQLRNPISSCFPSEIRGAGRAGQCRIWERGAG